MSINDLIRHFRPTRWLVAALLGLALFTAAPSWGASWEFHSIPVTNTCIDWFLWPIGCTPWYLPPGGSSVFNCSTGLLTTLHGLAVGVYFPLNPVMVDPPTICYFNNCSDVSITVTCFTPNADPALQKTQEYRLEKADVEALKRQAYP